MILALTGEGERKRKPRDCSARFCASQEKGASFTMMEGEGSRSPLSLQVFGGGRDSQKGGLKRRFERYAPRKRRRSRGKGGGVPIGVFGEEKGAEHLDKNVLKGARAGGKVGKWGGDAEQGGKIGTCLKSILLCIF